MNHHVTYLSDRVRIVFDPPFQIQTPPMRYGDHVVVAADAKGDAWCDAIARWESDCMKMLAKEYVGMRVGMRHRYQYKIGWRSLIDLPNKSLALPIQMRIRMEKNALCVCTALITHVDVLPDQTIHPVLENVQLSRVG